MKIFIAEQYLFNSYRKSTCYVSLMCAAIS